MHLTDLYCILIYVTSHWIWGKKSMSYVKKMERWPKIKCHQLKKGGDWWELVVKLWPWCCHWEGEKNKPTPPGAQQSAQSRNRCEMLTRNTSEEKLTVVKWEDGKWTGWKMQIMASVLLRTCSGLQRGWFTRRVHTLCSLSFVCLSLSWILGQLKTEMVHLHLWCMGHISL